MPLINPVPTTGWNIGGSAFVSTNTIELTQATGQQGGDIYYNTPENITALCNQFSVNFDFQIVPSGSPADATSFWYISNAPSWSLPFPPAGYPTGEYSYIPANPNGLILILDTWDNDNNFNNPLETLLGYNGTESVYNEGSNVGQLGSVVPNQNFITDGAWHHCQIIYNNGTITVYFNNSTTASITGTYTLNQSGYFGFSASTGGSYSKQSIRNVIITDSIPPPTVTTSSFCQFAPASALIATGASTSSSFTWYDASGAQLPGAPTPNTSVIGTATYYVSQQEPGACPSHLDTVHVTINSQPAAPVITGITAYCPGATFVPFTVAGTGILWYPSATGGGAGSAVAPVTNTNVPGTYTYYASQNTNGCESARDSITVTVYPVTPVPSVTGSVTYCQADVPVSLAGDATGQSLLWYTNPPTGPGAAIAPTPSTATPGTTIYYVSQTINGCQGDSVAINVLVKQKPNLVFNISDTQVCVSQTDTLTYTGDAAPGSTYNWVFPPGDVVMSGSGAGPLVVGFYTPGTAQINFNVTDNGCTSNDTTIDVSVIQSPAPMISFSPDVCIGLPDLISFNASSVNGLNEDYNWDFNNGIIMSGDSASAGPYKIVWNATGTYTVSLSVSLNGCPSDTTKDEITVHPLPDVHIVPLTTDDICIGDSLLVAASTTTVPVYAYQWMPYTYFNVNNLVSVYGIIEATGYVSVRAISDYGCTNTDSVFVNTHPCCDVALPDAFTPNNDGKNDIFRIIGVRPQKIVAFRIFDRWGQVVFNATDNNGWDGTFNGTPQAIGTYFYSISYICADDKEYEKKGNVVLIR